VSRARWVSETRISRREGTRRAGGKWGELDNEVGVVKLVIAVRGIKTWLGQMSR